MTEERRIGVIEARLLRFMALSQYQIHYHEERNHQGLENEIIQPGDEVGCVDGAVQCRNRLGGMLRYYFRDAA